MLENGGRLKASILDAAVELMGRSGRGGTVRVHGSSMLPTLFPGQLLAVEFAPQGLRRGDLLLFRQLDYLVVHRLLGRARAPAGRSCLKTRGDGVPGLDPPLERGRVVGRVIAIQDQDGKWLSLRGTGARWYARCLAFHDRFWAAVVYGAGRCEGGLRRLQIRTPLRSWSAAADRWLARQLKRALFVRLHEPTAPPQEIQPE
jgi:hypothetical protein